MGKTALFRNLDGRVVATIDDAAYRSWEPRSVKYDDESCWAFPLDQIRAAREAKVKHIMLYEGTGLDRVEHRIDIGGSVLGEPAATADKKMVWVIPKVFFETTPSPVGKPELQPSLL